MQLDGFITALSSLWDERDPQVADHPRDRRFRALLDEIGGMASENKLALLNLAAHFLNPDECYLEIGTYLGTSVIAATMGNSEKRFIAIDNFSQFGGPEETCRANIARLAESDVNLVVTDAWAFLRNPEFSTPIGVYFYDGGHTFNEQWRALELIEPYLSNEALIVIDDASHAPVRMANRLFVRSRPQFASLAHFHSSRNGEPRWWNGLDVFAYRRASAQASTDPRHTKPWLASLLYGPCYETAQTLATKAYALLPAGTRAKIRESIYRKS